LATRTGNIAVTIKTYSSGTSYAGTYGIVVKETIGISCKKIVPIIAINSAAFDLSGNMYIAGYGNHLVNQYSKRDVWVKKYNPLGTEITSGWNKKIDWGHSDNEYATRILFDGTNIIIAGQGNDLINGASTDDGWVKKLNASGIEILSFMIPDANATLVKYDGNYWFTGGSSVYNLALRKYNAFGVLSVSFNHLSDYVNYPVFTIDSGDNVYVSGEKSDLVTTDSNYDWIFRKFNSVGVEQ
jgi:Ca2+-binding RTX toxin-like protein